MHVSLLSNVNLLTVTKTLRSRLEVRQPEGYGIWLPEFIKEDSAVIGPDTDLVFLVLEGTELTKDRPATDLLDGYLSTLAACAKRRPSIRFFISDLYVRPREITAWKSALAPKAPALYWNERLRVLCEEMPNIFAFDLTRLIETAGNHAFFSDKLWYLASAPFSLKGEAAIAGRVLGLAESMSSVRKKCLVLDLDNTLWGGEIGSVSGSGIELSGQKEGARFQDFQKRLLEIKNTGAVLTICSKNNEEDALSAFDNPQMVLQKNDFAAMRINWNPKSENIRAISAELHLSLDSMVFVDDNPAERELVRQHLPEVTVAAFPDDTANLNDFAVALYNRYFFTFSVSEEDRRRSEMYQENARRGAFKSRFSDLASYFESLSMKAIIGDADKSEIPRIAQLTQKTNQFNLTTKRYGEKEIEAFLRGENSRVVSVSLSDRFGDNGLCCVVILKEEGKSAQIDTFLLSCRVMGRDLEYAVMDYVKRRLRNAGFQRLAAQYIPTKKNVPARDFYPCCGFSVLKTEGEAVFYEMDLTRASQSRKHKIAVEERKGNEDV